MSQLPSEWWILLETLLRGCLSTDFSSVWVKPSFTRKIFNLILRGRTENQTPTFPLPLHLARLLSVISKKDLEHYNQCKLNINCREMSVVKAQTEHQGENRGLFQHLLKPVEKLLYYRQQRFCS